MEKQIKIVWGKQDIQNDRHEITVTIHKEANSDYYKVPIRIIENVGYQAVNNMGLPIGYWDINLIYDEIDSNSYMFKEDDIIYIHAGIDEKKGNQSTSDFFPFGNTRLEYFIPASNNNNSSSSASEGEGEFLQSYGGRRKSLFKKKRTKSLFKKKRTKSLFKKKRTKRRKRRKSKKRKTKKKKTRKTRSKKKRGGMLRRRQRRTYTAEEQEIIRRAFPRGITSSVAEAAGSYNRNPEKRVIRSQKEPGVQKAEKSE